jgi:hypothetical protein
VDPSGDGGGGLTATGLICAACGTELPPDSRFCNKCGAPIAPPVTSAEYKQVTVLFADVVHSMDIAAAVGRMIGVGDDTENLTVPQMLDLGAGARAGLLLTRHLPDNVLQRLQARYTPPTSVSTGISLCLNKRLSSSKTQHLLGWSPRRTDILTEIESGSYTNRS